ncbi:MAG: AAA family ATPase [Cypionkella sp.]|uniref:ParA family protein n=1 Tax=Cypionkella sp. TaxID=2811411 RepID=UPI002AB94F77|nr:AAA family ATPase [Cypionkella sp.]MDZ4313131.1 AAA family ATPase [Cypionkella sp.]
MSMISLSDLTTLASAATEPGLAKPAPPRLMSIWEITTWILPMAPEHLRRVLASDPALPQGSAGVEGGTRWFTAAEVARLRAHFSQGARKTRYQPPRPANSKAPLITLTQPQGRAGRSTAALHLATAAALAGYRVLLIDADPAGALAQALRVSDGAEIGVLGLIARSAARHLRQGNEARLDRGEVPVAMDAVLSAALALHTSDLIRPTLWPGLDLLPAAAGLMQADLQIGRWRMAQARWQPWRALAEGLDGEDLRSRYDLIFCDTGRGLGPLALSVLASADVLLAPLPLIPGALGGLGAGLAALARALSAVQDEAQMVAQALGQTVQPLQWRKLAVLPTRAGGDAAQRLAHAARLGPALLPAALPEIAQIANGTAAQFYDLDYRDVGRLIYAPQREATEAAWRGMADLLAALWTEDSTPQSQLQLG